MPDDMADEAQMSKATDSGTLDASKAAAERQALHERRTALRTDNMNADNQRPDEEYFVRKDSSVKKNSAFVKKLKNVNDFSHEQILNDFTALNLTK